MPKLSPVAQPADPPTKADRALREAAQQMEVSFLAEMLKAAGLGESRGAFGGGEGEDQFASFLVREQAVMMVKAGGIGLTEALFETLKENTNDG